MKDVMSLARTFAVIGFLMYSIMGNSETWDQLLEMEMNATVNASEEADILDTAKECVGSACEAIQAGTCAVAAYDQEALDELLAIDGNDEFAVYLAPVGKI